MVNVVSVFLLLLEPRVHPTCSNPQVHRSGSSLHILRWNRIPFWAEDRRASRCKGWFLISPLTLRGDKRGDRGADFFRFLSPGRLGPGFSGPALAFLTIQACSGRDDKAGVAACTFTCRMIAAGSRPRSGESSRRTSRRLVRFGTLVAHKPQPAQPVPGAATSYGAGRARGDRTGEVRIMESQQRRRVQTVVKRGRRGGGWPVQPADPTQPNTYQ